MHLKKNIETLPTSSLITLSLIRPVLFDWKDPQDKYMQNLQYGFIPVLVASVQDLKRQNNALQSENEVLRKRLDEIEANLY
jgi:hypothetical protein